MRNRDIIKMTAWGISLQQIYSFILTLLISQSLLAQSFFDATRVNDLANDLIEELDKEINREDIRLQELSRVIEAAYVSGRPSEAASAEVEANQLMEKKNQRKDNCNLNMEAEVLSSVNKACGIEAMEASCNQAYGVSNEPEFNNILQGNNSSYNIAQETAAIETTKQEAITLIDKLGGVISSNNQCSEKIGNTAQSPCIDVFESFIQAYRNGNYKEKLKQECTLIGINQLKDRFTGLMEGRRGPAARIARAAAKHIGNRNQEILAARRLMTLKLIIDTVNGQRPMRRPTSINQGLGED